MVGAFPNVGCRENPKTVSPLLQEVSAGKATHILARACLQNLRQISALACWFLPSFWASFLHLSKGEAACGGRGSCCWGSFWAFYKVHGRREAVMLVVVQGVWATSQKIIRGGGMTS